MSVKDLQAVDLRIYFFGMIQDRKSTRLNSSHMSISYAVFCLKKNIIRVIEQPQAELGTAGRVFIRPSGTVPLIRVMFVGEYGPRLHTLADMLFDAIPPAA